MPRGNRSLLAPAIFGLAATCFGLGAYTGVLNYSQQKRYESYRYAPDKPQEIDPALARPSGSKPLEYRSPCENPKGKDESDLCAQWRAADAAENSALWAKWGFWVAVAGIIGLYLQVHLTRKAVEDTGEATNEMRKANDIAADSNRAWLRLNRLNAFNVVFEKQATMHAHVGISVELENVGDAAANDVQALGLIYFMRPRAGNYAEINVANAEARKLLEARYKNARSPGRVCFRGEIFTLETSLTSTEVNLSPACDAPLEPDGQFHVRGSILVGYRTANDTPRFTYVPFLVNGVGGAYELADMVYPVPEAKQASFLRLPEGERAS